MSTPDYDIERAIAEIRKFDKKRVSIVGKAKTLVKLGRKDNLGTTEETVWLLGGSETYVTDNDIDSIVSDNVADTQEVVIEGHTVDANGDLTFVVQTATLNGATRVALSTPLHRATRLYNNNSTDFAGTVKVYENGGNDHLTTDGANNQSLKCATSLSSQDYWILTGMLVSVNRQNSRSADFKLKIREKGKVFRTRFSLNAHSNGGSVYVPFRPCIIAKPNSDVEVTAVASGTSTVVEATLFGYLALIN